MQNMGGLNTADSPLAVKDDQATGGYNYDYVKTGGILKSLCASKLNTVADAQLKTLGLFLRNTRTSSKSIVRAAGTKIQLTDLGGTFANMTEDKAAAGSDFLASGSSQPVVSSMFVTPSVDVLWLAGGGMAGIYGAYSDSKVTANGSEVPGGSISSSESGGGGEWATTGVYRYAIARSKASTGALSNVALELAHTLTSITNSIVIDLSAITGTDTTRDDFYYLYRSAVGGAEEFTTGDLVATIATTETSYTDTGSSISESENVPRAGNTVLDNSALEAGTYKTLATWKRRLVTATESTIRIADLNKPESWPLENVIEVPSGGAITGLAIISFTPNAASTDEFLAVFKEGEVWIVSGDDADSWRLKYVDNSGSINQSLIVAANGFLFFIDNRGAYLWDGMGKPYYISRPIEDLFGTNGQLDRAKLYMGTGSFFRRQNQVVWYLSHGLLGEQKYVLKLDVRMTVPRAAESLGQKMVDGVFLPGKVNNPVYASSSFVFPTSSSQEDVLITGDDAGFCYRQFYSTTGVDTNDFDFSYTTKNLDLGRPGIDKQFYAVHVWVENVGNWDLLLDYWTEWRNSEDDKSTVAATINAATDGTIALWDVAKWDQAKWDGFISKPVRLVFNLQASTQNNASGEVIKLRLRNSESDEPVSIYGFAVVWADKGLVK